MFGFGLCRIYKFLLNFFEFWLFFVYVVGFFCICSLKWRMYIDVEWIKCVLFRLIY